MYGETTECAGSDVGFKICELRDGYAIIETLRYERYPDRGKHTGRAFMSRALRYQYGTLLHNGKVNEIIDSMPALEILFYAAQKRGHPNWYSIA